MNIRTIFFSIISIIIGAIFIYGTAKNKWKAVLNPPPDSSKLTYFYSQSLIKKLFGEDALIVFNYSLGVIFIIFGLVKLLILLFSN